MNSDGFNPFFMGVEIAILSMPVESLDSSEDTLLEIVTLLLLLSSGNSLVLTRRPVRFLSRFGDSWWLLESLKNIIIYLVYNHTRLHTIEWNKPTIISTTSDDR